MWLCRLVYFSSRMKAELSQKHQNEAEENTVRKEEQEQTDRNVSVSTSHSHIRFAFSVCLACHWFTLNFSLLRFTGTTTTLYFQTICNSAACNEK